MRPGEEGVVGVDGADDCPRDRDRVNELDGLLLRDETGVECCRGV